MTDMVYEVRPLPRGRTRRTAVVAKTRVGDQTHVFKGILATDADWVRFYQWLNDVEAAAFERLLLPARTLGGSPE